MPAEVRQMGFDLLLGTNLGGIDEINNRRLFRVQAYHLVFPDGVHRLVQCPKLGGIAPG
ncbi:hypothetical protein D3C71_2250610 [compost metagenome]